MQHRIFIALVFLLHLFYFICALSFADIYTDDSEEYTLMAENIQNEGVIYSWHWSETPDPKYYTLRPPLYGLLILFTKWIWDTDFAILVLQNILSLLTIFALEQLVRRWGVGKERYIILTLGLLLFPTYMIFVNMVMTDFLLGIFLFWGFYSVYRYIEEKRLGWLLLYNLILCAALYLKPVLIYFWVPNLLFSIWLFLLNRRWPILIMPFLLLGAMQLWNARNEQVTGWNHFSSIQTINICNFNMRQLLRTKYDWPTADSTVAHIWKVADQKEDFAEHSEYLMDTCKNVLLQNFPTYSYVHIRGMFSFFLDPGRHDILKFFRIQPRKMMSFFNELDKRGLTGLWNYFQNISIGLLLIYIIVFFWNIITLVCFLRFPFDKRLDVRLRILLFGLVGYVCMLSVTIGYSRFKVGLYPLLLIVLVMSGSYFWKHYISKFIHKIRI